jgi:hypothetical protein
MEATYRKGGHSVFSFQWHTYFVTAYCRKCLTQAMVEHFRNMATNVLGSVFVGYMAVPSYMYMRSIEQGVVVLYHHFLDHLSVAGEWCTPTT